MENLNNPPIENSKMELDNVSLNYLNETRKWTMFLAIVGFVFLGLILIASLAVLAAGSSMAIPGMASFMFIPLFLICVLYFFPIYYLYQFSVLSKKALAAQDNGLLTTAMKYLKMYYKFVGILVIVILSIYIVVILIALAAGSLFSIFH
jgi:hypothetical protein